MRCRTEPRAPRGAVFEHCIEVRQYLAHARCAASPGGCADSDLALRDRVRSGLRAGRK
jgi:hypothetical protein